MNPLTLSASITLPEIIIPDEAWDQRSALISGAKEIDDINSKEEADYAGKVLNDILTITKDVESARKTVKAPFKAVCDELDAKAKEFSTALIAEKTRLGNLIAAWSVVEKANREAEEQKARDAARAAHEAAANTIRDGGEADLSEVKAAQEQVKLVQAQYKPDSVTVVMDWDYEVEDVNALFASNPHLVKLVPDAGLLRAMVDGGCRELPGVRIFQKASLRTKRKSVR